MRKLNITLGLSIAALAVSVTGCENVPTQSDDHIAVVATTTSNIQSRVTLCHRGNNGEYAQITVADVAYDNHMEHGDRQANVGGGCPSSETSRLELSVEFVENEPGTGVLVDNDAGDDLGACGPGDTCAYDVPVGSIVNLTGGYLYFWEGGSCEIQCSIVMDDDLDVLAEQTVL